MLFMLLELEAEMSIKVGLIMKFPKVLYLCTFFWSMKWIILVGCVYILFML